MRRLRFTERKQLDVTKPLRGGAHIIPWLHLTTRLRFFMLSSTQWLLSFHLHVVSNVPEPPWEVHNTVRGGPSWFRRAAVGRATVSYRCVKSGQAGLRTRPSVQEEIHFRDRDRAMLPLHCLEGVFSMGSSHLISLNHSISTFHNDQVCFFKGALKQSHM